jgi:DNA-binding SARP family transcriptional activator
MRLAGTTRDLLAYFFTCAGQQIRRERLVDLFWLDSDPVRGRGALNTALWRIKIFLGNIPGMAMHSTPELVCVQIEPKVVIDARQLESTVKNAAIALVSAPRLSPELRATLAADLDAYMGPFLDGSTSDWVLVERERLFNLYVRGLSILCRTAAIAVAMRMPSNTAAASSHSTRLESGSSAR